MSLESMLSNRKGPFAAVAGKFEPKSIRTASQLMREMQKKPKLMGDYYLFNTAIYSINRGKAVLHLSEGSPLINDNRVIISLIHGNHVAPKKDISDYLSGAKAYVDRLGAEPRNRETALLMLDELDGMAHGLNKDQRAIAELAFGDVGSGDYGRSMAFLWKAGLAPGIRVLNPSYVMDNAKGKHLVRSCAFQRRDDTLIFNACYRELGNHLQMRGVLKPESAEGPSGDWAIRKAHQVLSAMLEYLRLPGRTAYG